MKGKVTSEAQELDYGKKEKTSYKEDSIDQYYKGKAKNSVSLEIEDDPHGTNQEEEGIDPAELKEALSFELEEELLKEENDKIKKFEEELEQKKKDQKKLDLEQEREKNKKNATKVDQLDSHLRGNISTDNLDDEDDHDSLLNSSIELSLEDDVIDDSIQLQIDEDELNHRNNGLDLDIDADNEDLKRASSNEKLGGHLTGESKNSQKNVDEKQMNEAGVDHLETHYKGHFDHRKPDEDRKKDDSSSLDFKMSKDSLNGQSKKQSDDEAEGLDEKKSNLEVGVSKENTSKKSNHKDDEFEDDFDFAKIKKNLHLGLEDEDDTTTSEQDPKGMTSAEGTSQIEDDEDHRQKKTSSAADDEGQFPSLMGNSSTDKQEKKNGLADARADHLQKHYKGKGNSHQEQGWGSLHQKKSRANDEFEKPKLALTGLEVDLDAPKLEEYGSYNSQSKKKQVVEYEGSEQAKKKAPGYEFDDGSKYGTEYQLNEKKRGPETSYELADAALSADTSAFSNEKVAIGDQVIDYNKLKKEFEAMGMDTDSQLFQSFLEDIDPSIDIADKIEELISEGNQIFEAMPCGLDIIITAQELYQFQDTQKVFDYIAKSVLERYQAKMTVYTKDTIDFQEIYSIFDHSFFQENERKEWTLLKSVKLPFWKLMTLPTLGDHTFEENENEFLYPIFEAKDHLGYIILTWDKISPFVLTEDTINEIEAVLESTRGLFLKEKGLTNSNINKKIKEEKGLLGRFFGKKAS